MGAAIPISLHTLERQRVSKWTLLYKIFRRSIILFGLGLFLNNGFDLQHWRIPGVLQRFGGSYLVKISSEKPLIDFIKFFVSFFFLMLVYGIDCCVCTIIENERQRKRSK
jgi:hypothetical protein